jgi:hypothetical protein
MSEGTALIKFTRGEIELLINSLHMSISTVVPCVSDGEWKKPYERIKSDLIDVKEQLIEGEREIRVDVKKEETGTNNPEECYDCED